MQVTENTPLGEIMEALGTKGLKSFTIFSDGSGSIDDFSEELLIFDSLTHLTVDMIKRAGKERRYLHD